VRRCLPLMSNVRPRKRLFRPASMEQSLYKWLDKIEARPGLYLSEPSFACLTSFIAGFEIALISRHVSDDTDPPFSSFDKYVAQRLEHRTTEEERSNLGGPSWSRCILAVETTDVGAFNLFFTLLREFRARGLRE
jgi:hypothetical protein